MFWNQNWDPNSKTDCPSLHLWATIWGQNSTLDAEPHWSPLLGALRKVVCDGPKQTRAPWRSPSRSPCLAPCRTASPVSWLSLQASLSAWQRLYGWCIVATAGVAPRAWNWQRALAFSSLGRQSDCSHGVRGPAPHYSNSTQSKAEQSGAPAPTERACFLASLLICMSCVCACVSPTSVRVRVSV